MKKRRLIPLLSLVAAIVATSVSAEILPKDGRVIIRKPLGEAVTSEIKYDGWIIEGDPFFHKMMIKHLKYIKKHTPELYKKGQKHVKKFFHRGNTGSAAAPWLDLVGIGQRDIDFRQYGDDWVINAIVHEIQHCLEYNGSEGAACWSAVVYGPKLKFHPAMVKYLKAIALSQGYSQEKWDKLEK
tara:strand:+ start:123 stop:674 length:552 start_codon:yes stop_codon:yes gene_type:complete